MLGQTVAGGLAIEQRGEDGVSEGVFGNLAVSYVVVPAGPGESHLVVKLVTVPAGGVVGAVMRRRLPAGDLVMMRRQLLNLKALVEATATDAMEARS